ncbi:MAG: 1-deoxy-D-xylulose-5-phosphate reductoisomerase [Ruminococcaceae bacterium]|nr:1-deoxy-D-xylulose-5-phosphate reductoisomerase [Oscillospiraceae bacterium]
MAFDSGFEKSVAIFGSTGSIGTQSIEVARRHKIKIKALTARGDVDRLEEQIREFSPEVCALLDENKAKELKDRVADTSTKIVGGERSIEELAFEVKCDMFLNSIIGKAGLRPTLAAIESGKNIALANKETLVTAGSIVMQKARDKGVSVLPVDSEHCAIFQCLEGYPAKQVSRLILTASGGPFFGKKRDELVGITPEMALAHPTWNMGKKITIDSATLMNKGFEVIEACHLFDVPVDKIDVVVHRESIIHSMVEYIDNAVLAQMGVPDMRTCIQYALTYPDRYEGLQEKLDLAKVGKMTFAEADKETFVLLDLAYRSMRMGGLIPAVLNGANEEAVYLFLDHKISFTDIMDSVKAVVLGYKNIESPTLEEIEAADIEARAAVRRINGII